VLLGRKQSLWRWPRGSHLRSVEQGQVRHTDRICPVYEHALERGPASVSWLGVSGPFHLMREQVDKHIARGKTRTANHCQRRGQHTDQTCGVWAARLSPWRSGAGNGTGGSGASNGAGTGVALPRGWLRGCSCAASSRRAAQFPA